MYHLRYHVKDMKERLICIDSFDGFLLILLWQVHDLWKFCDAWPLGGKGMATTPPHTVGLVLLKQPPHFFPLLRSST